MTIRNKFWAIGLGTALAVGSIASASAAGLIFSDDFEGSAVDTGKTWEKVRVNVPTVSTEQAREGKSSMKVVLSYDQENWMARERNEVRMRDTRVIKAGQTVLGQTYWYGFSVFLPKTYVSDSVWELVAQWYQDADNSAEWNVGVRQPPLSLNTTNGTWSIAGKSDPRSFTADKAGITSSSFKVGAYQTNKWTDWVFQVKWSYGSDGFIKAWKDGVQVLNTTGPNCFNDTTGPYFKIGIYKGWHNIKAANVTQRTLFIDSVRMAGADGTFAAVAPQGAGTKTVIPQPPAYVKVE